MGGDLTRHRAAMAMIAMLALVTASCGARSAQRAADAAAVTPPSCDCDASRDRPRCVGASVEHCVAGRWQVTQGCTASQVCALGQCRGLAASTGCPDEVRYNNVDVVIDRHPPVKVSDCISGGGLGRSVGYHETKSEVHNRAVAFVGMSGCAAPFATVTSAKLSAAFGLDVDGQVSTDYSLGPPTAWVPPKHFGTVYRQTERVERVAELYRQGRYVGLAILTDWVFTPDIAVGPSCPAPSALPSAQTWRRCVHQSDGCVPCLGAEP